MVVNNSPLPDINSLVLQRFAMKEGWFSAYLLLLKNQKKEKKKKPKQRTENIALQSAIVTMPIY